MNNDFKTIVIYLLTLFVIVLLIVLKRQQNHMELIKEEYRVYNHEKARQEKEVAALLQDSIATLEEKKLGKVKGVIGLIIDDFGYRNDNISKRFLSLPGNLTYAVIPGHEHSKRFSQQAVVSGYEIIIHMPMENIGKTYGEEEYVLMTSFSKDEIWNRIDKAFLSIPEATGLNNHQGSKASASYPLMKIIAENLKGKNKFFIDSRTASNSVGMSTMKEYGVPTNQRNIFLDNDLDEELIFNQLMKLVRLSEKRGAAIGIGHVKLQTLSVLEKNIPDLINKGFKFEFVSKMVNE